MAEDKKSIIVYADWKNIFEELSDDEAGKLIKHFFRYVNDLNPEAPDRLTKLLFEPIKQTLKRDLVKYEDKREKNRKNALLRWDNKNANASERIKSDANHADSVSDSVNVSDSVSVKKKKKAFIPPSLLEVETYFIENGYKKETALKMFNSYSVANWIDSKGNPVQNWKQKAINVWFKDENKISTEFVYKQTTIPKDIR